MLGNMCYDQLMAQEKMVATSVVDVAQILIRIGLAGLALWAGFGLLGVYVVTILTGIGRSGLLWGCCCAAACARNSRLTGRLRARC